MAHRPGSGQATPALTSPVPSCKWKSSQLHPAAWCCRGQSQRFTKALSDLNIFFVCVFCLEAVTKIAALNPLAYIRNNW